MATNYRVPGVAVHQSILQSANTGVPDQDVAIVGGLASLRLYSQNANAKADCYKGQYVSGTAMPLVWERDLADDAIDFDFTKVYFEKALLQFAEGTATQLANSYNQLQVIDDGTVFTERGLKVGDGIVVTAGDEQVYTSIYQLDTVLGSNAVTDVAVVPAETNAAAVAAANATTPVGNAAVVNSGLRLAAAVSGSWVPPAGKFKDEFTVTVVTGGALDTAKLQLTSDASGISEQFAFDDYDDAVEVLTGLNLTLTAGTSELTAGMTWTFTASAVYTPATLLVSGEYKSTDNTTYVIDVKKGGSFTSGNAPVVRIRTISGSDTVLEVPLTTGQPILFGTRGLTLTASSGSGLIQGESFEYNTNAQVITQDTKIITLSANLPKVTTETVRSIKACLIRNFEVPKNAYSQDDEQLTLNTTITATDTVFPERLLPVLYADVYVESRIWSTAVTSAGTANTVADLDRAIKGEIHPANPVKYGIYRALQNANGRPVHYAVVANPSKTESWQNAFTRLSKNRNAYAIAPMSDEPAIKSLAVSFVAGESSDAIGRYKEAWLGASIPKSVPVITYSDDHETLAIVADNPLAAGTRYDYVIANEEVFANVRAGDEFRTLYYTKTDGTLGYSSRLITRIINNKTVVLEKPFDDPITVQQRYEVVRPITSQNFNEYAVAINEHHNRRVINVYPGEFVADGYTLPGYFAAASVAAYTMSLNPNESSTLKTVSGFQYIPGYEDLDESNLNALAVAGTFIVGIDSDGIAFIRHALTTGNPDMLNEREESTTRNFDSVSNFYAAALNKLKGAVTATQTGLNAINSLLDDTSRALLTRYYTPMLGGQIVSYEIKSVSIDPVFLDCVNVNIELVLPHMANRIDLYLSLALESSDSAVTLNSLTTAT
jgi:hypothetical protein